MVSRPNINRTLGLYLLLAGSGVFLAAFRIYHVTHGGQLWFDAREVWRPLGAQVLNGAAPYVEVWDNKPPLWEYLVILLSATSFTVAGLLLVGLSNITASIGLHKLTVKETGSWTAGAIAAIVYLGSLPHLHGTIINVRSIANVLVIYGVYHRDSALRAGVGFALAGCLTQYAWALTPIFAGLGLRNHGRKWTGQYAVAGFGAAGVVFLPLFIWGFDVVLAGFRQTFLSFETYVAKPHHNILANPTQWVVQIAAVVKDNVILFSGVVGGGLTVRRWATRDEFGAISLVCALVFTLLLFVKSLRYYWLLPLPFYAVIIGYAVFQITTQPAEYAVVSEQAMRTTPQTERGSN